MWNGGNDVYFYNFIALLWGLEVEYESVFVLFIIYFGIFYYDSFNLFLMSIEIVFSKDFN